MKNFVMVSPLCTNAHNKLLDINWFNALQQWNDVRSHLNILGCTGAVGWHPGKMINTTFEISRAVLNAKVSEQVLIINDTYLLSSLANTTSQGEFIKKYLDDHNFELLNIDSLNKFDPLNCLWESELKTLWVGINEDFAYEDYLTLANLFEGEDLIVRPLTMNQGYTRLALYLNSIDGRVLIHENAFDEHAIYAISARYDALNNPLLYIPVSADDANLGAINSLVVGNKIIISKCSDDLLCALQIKGVEVIISDVDQFTTMGTKCLAALF